jgi:hypothetical protein
MSWWMLLVLVVGGLGLVNAALITFDLGGPFRNAILSLAAKRLASRVPRPPAVERTYWTGGEYQKDAARLGLLGYEVASETDTRRYVEGASIPGRPPMRRRVPIAHVLYELRT